jgi:hypothetical protein
MLSEKNNSASLPSKMSILLLLSSIHSILTGHSVAPLKEFILLKMIPKHMKLCHWPWFPNKKNIKQPKVISDSKVLKMSLQLEKKFS